MNEEKVLDNYRNISQFSSTLSHRNRKDQDKGDLHFIRFKARVKVYLFLFFDAVVGEGSSSSKIPTELQVPVDAKELRKELISARKQLEKFELTRFTPLHPKVSSTGAAAYSEVFGPSKNLTGRHYNNAEKQGNWQLKMAVNFTYFRLDPRVN